MRRSSCVRKKSNVHVSFPGNQALFDACWVERPICFGKALHLTLSLKYIEMWVTSTEGVPWIKLWVLSVSSCSLRRVNRLLIKRSLFCVHQHSAVNNMSSPKAGQRPTAQTENSEWSKGLSQRSRSLCTELHQFKLFFTLKRGNTTFPNFPFPLFFFFFLCLFSRQLSETRCCLHWRPHSFHSYACWLLVAMEKLRNGADNSSMREQRL